MLIKSGCVALSTERVHLYSRYVRTPLRNPGPASRDSRAPGNTEALPLSWNVYSGLAFASPFPDSISDELELLGGSDDG